MFRGVKATAVVCTLKKQHFLRNGQTTKLGLQDLLTVQKFGLQTGSRNFYHFFLLKLKTATG